MKKRIITLLAVLALLVVCAAFSVSAAVDPNTDTCPCGCNQTLAQIAATNDGKFAYNANGINSGHYVFTSSSGPGAALTINKDQTVIVYITARLGKEDTPTDRIFPTIDVKSGATLYIVGNGGSITTGFPYKTLGTGRNGYAINIASGATVELSGDLTIRPGNEIAAVDTITVGDGGMIYNQGTLTIKDGVKINGAPEGNGGAIYTTGASARVNMQGGTITADSAFSGGQGAAVAVYSSAVFNMTGGTIINNCTGSKSGIRVQNGLFYMQGGEVKAVDGGDNRGAFDVLATATTSRGELVLAGTAKISNPDGGVSANNVKLQSAGGYGKLLVDNNWTGHANVNIPFSADKTYGKTYGRVGTDTYYAQCGKWDAENETFTQGNGHKGNLIAGGISSAPGLYGNSGLLMVMRVILLGEQDGESFEKWYITAETAFTANKTLKLDDAYVRLACSTSVKVPAGVDGVVDLNGVDVSSVTIGTGSTLSFWDQDVKAAGDDASGAVVTGTGYNSYYVRPNGATYVMNGGKCYRVAMKINTVSLRPTADQAGIYYTAAITAHENAGIAAWGMAVALADLSDLNEHLYTRETAAEGGTLGEFNSVLVSGVVKSDATDNADRAEQDVFAKAYIELADGSVVMSGAVSYSLNDLIDLAIEQGNSADKLAAIKDYAWFKELGYTV